jgi:DNA polymerase-3 subunit epsilon
MSQQISMGFDANNQQGTNSMSLQLNRPLAVIDLETTGINIGNDRIVEIAIVKIMPDGSRQVKRKLINPEMPIPPGSTEVHGISNEMVKDAPTFKQAANEIKMFMANCDLAGYNSNRFDIPLLVEEFLRAGLDIELNDRSLLDVQRVFHMMEQRTLSAAYKFYCDKILARRFVMDNGVEVFNFGKHKGKPVTLVLKQEPQYYDWMMKGDFPLHTKQKLTEILNRTLLKK